MVEQVNNEIIKYEDIKDVVNDPVQLRTLTEKLINSMIDQVTLGILFDAHRKHYTKTFNLDRDKSPEKMEPLPSHVDIFGNHNLKKTEDCVCPICDRQVAALRFAPHLESCMGMGRSRSRNVRRVTNNNKERENSTFSGLGSDDEDDADWNSNEKRSRKKKDRNGSKKGKDRYTKEEQRNGIFGYRGYRRGRRRRYDFAKRHASRPFQWIVTE
ncbi:SAGA-associated factor 11 homolog isoform X2 [Onthophagus taurus]|uniref:SAGA-associated factor 11 homolog isoform X2 n=1 Tax=Onthophagus taurus TaxID=166361 RepID=UPI000C208D4E|nr:SAGA-associated factor 11 homolog isoform X2 [Onthophagus taurus]